jgi:uncharacterized glyoxalase superfamily metalloenzyme YdcJ
MSETFLNPDEIRARFSAAMSQMYRAEVPAYGTLLDLVADVNAQVLAQDPALRDRLGNIEQLDRISDERHGAIRLGTSAELATMRRLFAVMGMYPVGYYDLTEANVPVHSTAFRPVGGKALRRNPFRVFTSLLRLDLIESDSLRQTAADLLARRDIFTGPCRDLTARAEANGGLTEAEADVFVREACETFRWHSEANVDAALYRHLHDAHRLIADVVSFRGPHINHLTPRTLDIDAVQDGMPLRGISPKALIEGPPRRACPILLRQTSFKALEEPVSFNGTVGSHSARFGEIEERGQALTPNGRALYDSLLTRLRAEIQPAADGSNLAAYTSRMAQVFADFPDDLHDMRAQGLGYFEWSVTAKGLASDKPATLDPEALLAAGLVQVDPVIYEDFLPVSAAGIFQSNLGDAQGQTFTASPNQQKFEADLGAAVLNEFDHYQSIESQSLADCLLQLRPANAAL